MMNRLKLNQRQHVAVVRELNMLINVQLTIEEVNQVLSALNVALVDKIKNQAMAQIQAAQAPSAVAEAPAAE
jgi:hypothetical protein